MPRKRILVLGSTGSIGTNTLSIAERLRDRFTVLGLSASSNGERLLAQSRAHRARYAVLMDRREYPVWKKRFARIGTRLWCGEEGLCRLAALSGVDILVMAIAGTRALSPLLASMGKSRRVALANKESVVSAGPLLMARARQSGTVIIPVDSEHSALFQCLDGRDRDEVRTLYLTGSGGPLLSVRGRSFDTITVQDVLAHPRWNMGRKITVDSATLMNKGLEVIEARWLFGLPLEMIKVVIHPEAIVHSMVEFVDGSILAQMAVPDMRIPIQYALTYPQRLPTGTGFVGFPALGRLSFEAPDTRRFPLLALAYDAARAGGTAPAALNSANEVAANAFLAGEIPFSAIARIVRRALLSVPRVPAPTLDDIIATEQRTGACAQELCARYARIHTMKDAPRGGRRRCQ